MVRKKNHLVCQHLEHVSAKALEQYQDIIRDYIRGRHGVYALYKRDRLYYLGLATNLRTRLRTHLRDRHKGLWDSFSVYLIIESHHVKELESLFLRILRPKGNSKRGSFPKSEDLKRRLLREIRERQREELEVLAGKRIKITRRTLRRKTDRRRKHDTVLTPYIKHRIRIEAEHNNVQYKATIRRNGWIFCRGYLYATPSALATEICGRRINGWTFWKYERSRGDWVPLDTLRR